MKVLFLQDVPNVAEAGTLKQVADGYARNYLLPRGLAVPATKEQQKQLDIHKQAIARRKATAEAEARALAEQIGATQVVIKAKVGEAGRLYGSITSADIAEELSRRLGQGIDRRKIELPDPLKTSGEHEVPFRFSKDIVTTIKVLVEAEPA